MHKISKENLPKISHLFENWEETLIWTCLQGHLGEVWVKNISSPTSAQIIVGDFCFLAGTPNTLLAQNIPSNFSSDFILIVPKSDDWNPTIEKMHPGNFKKTVRYAIKKEPHIFNSALLKQFTTSIADNFSLRRIDKTLYHKALEEEWSYDFCSLFPSYQAYKEHGIGFMVLDGDTPVSGASSYSFYDYGIEFEVDTKKEYRRKGFATTCSATLILECMDRNLYPS